jgi:hypothetical protein
MLFGAVLWMHGSAPWMGLIGFAGVLYVMFAWWSEVVHEGQTGDHTPVVRIGLRYGFILFIMSEVMFFSAWFWTFFKQRDVSDGAGQPDHRRRLAAGRHRDLRPLAPAADQHADPAASGCAVTWAHHALVHENDRKGLINGPDLAVAWAVHLHRAAGLRIQPRRLRLRRQHLWRDLLHGDRLPRLPRHHRHDLPARLPDPSMLKGHFTPNSMSASRPRPGTGTSSTWSGCSCSPPSTSGATVPR